MSAFRTLDDVNVSGKKVVIRLDLNVPMENDHVTDTTRIDLIRRRGSNLLQLRAILIASFNEYETYLCG